MQARCEGLLLGWEDSNEALDTPHLPKNSSRLGLNGFPAVPVALTLSHKPAAYFNLSFYELLLLKSYANYHHASSFDAAY